MRRWRGKGRGKEVAVSAPQWQYLTWDCRVGMGSRCDRVRPPGSTVLLSSPAPTQAGKSGEKEGSGSLTTAPSVPVRKHSLADSPRLARRYWMRREYLRRDLLVSLSAAFCCCFSSLSFFFFCFSNCDGRMRGRQGWENERETRVAGI